MKGGVFAMRRAAGNGPAGDKGRQAIEILRNAKLRVTSCRTSLLDFLLDAKDPLTQKELTESLVEQGFNRVTIYRALQSFLDAFIVHRIVTEDRTWRFAITRCGHRGHCHPHFSCRECGRIRCLDGIAIPAVNLKGHRIEAQAMYLWGLCPKCLQEAESAQ
jgi:Fur family ferric uptake transcriptional regulator